MDHLIESIAQFSNDSEFGNEPINNLQRLHERLHGGFRVEDLKPIENYVQRDFDIVVEFTFKADGEKYDAFLTRIPSRHLKIGNTITPDKEFDGVSIGCKFKGLIRLADGKFSDSPQSIAIPSLVRLKRTNNGPNGFRQFVYFSLDTHRFKIAVAPRSWECNRTVGAVSTSNFADQIVEAVPQVSRNLSCQNTDIRGYFLLGDNKLYNVFSTFQIALFAHGAYLRMNGSVDLPIEIIDIFFGPLDYCEGLVQG